MRIEKKARNALWYISIALFFIAATMFMLSLESAVNVKNVAIAYVISWIIFTLIVLM